MWVNNASMKKCDINARHFNQKLNEINDICPKTVIVETFKKCRRK